MGDDKHHSRAKQKTPESATRHRGALDHYGLAIFN